MRTWFVALIVVLTLLGACPFGESTARAQEGGPTAQPPLGSAVPIIGADGGEIVQITVTGIEDPFEDYDQGAPPERSYHYVLLYVDIENTGSRPYTFNSFGITLQDAEGFLYQQTYLYRTEEQIAADPDFTGEDIEPGDTASGVVGFQVLNGAELVRVVFQPEFDRLIFLADLTVAGAAPPVDADDADDTDDAGDASAATPESESAVAVETDDADEPEDDTAGTEDSAGSEDTEDPFATDDTDDTGADSDDADTGDTDTDIAAVDLSDEECDDVAAWLDDATPALEALDETLDTLLSEDPIPADALAGAADDLIEVAETVRDSDPPAALEDAATALADGLDAYAGALADAAESGEDLSFEDFAATVDTTEADDLLEEAGTLSDPIFEACAIDV